MNKVENILIVLANTSRSNSHREGLLYNLFKTYVEEAKKQGLKVTIIDLGKDRSGFLCGKEIKREKQEEFQIKIKNVERIIFFHPVLWSLPSSDIKAFVDKVFTPGFAFTTQKGIVYGQLENKSIEIFATTETRKWHEMFVSNNALSYFWNRIVSDKCGFRNSKLHLIANYRSLNDQQIEKWHEFVRKSITKYNQSNSILDLF